MATTKNNKKQNAKNANNEETKMTIGITIGIISTATAGIFVGVIGITITTYNKLSIAKNTIKGQGQNYRNLVEQRATILNRIIKIAGKTAQFEKSALKEVIAQRKVAKDAKQLWQWVKEAYPKLESIEGMQNVKNEINRIEENITTLKHEISEAIYDYNNMILVFPTNIIGRLIGGFETLEFRGVMNAEAFKTEDAERLVTEQINNQQDTIVDNLFTEKKEKNKRNSK